jgi:hypothetical protein
MLVTGPEVLTVTAEYVLVTHLVLPADAASFYTLHSKDA